MGWGGSGLSQQGLESLPPNLVDLGTPHWLLSASNPPSPPGRSREQELGMGAPGEWPIRTWFSLWGCQPLLPASSSPTPWAQSTEREDTSSHHTKHQAVAHPWPPQGARG